MRHREDSSIGRNRTHKANELELFVFVWDCVGSRKNGRTVAPQSADLDATVQRTTEAEAAANAAIAEELGKRVDAEAEARGAAEIRLDEIRAVAEDLERALVSSTEVRCPLARLFCTGYPPDIENREIMREKHVWLPPYPYPLRFYENLLQ